ncbi:Glycosyl transferase family 2 [Clostridium collagenovorans DSM 3089]|uniref:Glycosyl transferase family 2 n=1 Tax=Clostridium collagenovorans DSM 3089 TaxID=1121306 RepID=A0A1M5YJ98_9CLOT|nr:glycosyltransferase [Clostridium collagenovorans]SHI12100.1 Glycosyl transferase family 2 [Clostridium collagenovorans DSM 3089]
MYKKGLVSIIIPSFNGEKFITQTIDNCINQDYKNIEIIVIDDGSTDNTKQILTPYIDKNLINYIYQSNKGLPGARNTGLNVATGEFVQFLDADDLLDKNKIFSQVMYLNNNPNIFGVYCKSKYFKNSINEIFQVLDIHYDDNMYKKLLDVNFFTVHSILIRNTEFRFDETLKSLEDWDFWLTLTYNNKLINYIDESCCYVRVHGNNMCKNSKRMLTNELNVLNKNLNRGKFLDIINFNIFKRKYLLNETDAKNFYKLAVNENKKFIIEKYKFITKHKLKIILKKSNSIYEDK